MQQKYVYPQYFVDDGKRGRKNHPRFYKKCIVYENFSLNADVFAAFSNIRTPTSADFPDYAPTPIDGAS